MNVESLYSSVARGLRASEIRELLKLTEKPDVISFAGGLPNPLSFPVAEIQEAANRVFQNHAKKAFQYSATEGIEPLREQLALAMGRENMDVDPSNILVTNGSQQGLDLLGRVLLDKGDVVLAGNPSYLGALQAFNVYGCTYAGIDSDEDGMKPEHLEETLARLKAEGRKPKFLYTVPTFQNPSGTVIPEARRRKILEIAKAYDLLIVEDDPYGRLRFDGDAVPTFLSMDKGEGNVLYFGTFSKVLVPGFRLAWTTGPKGIISKMTIAKQSIDLCTNAFTQYIAADLLETNLIDKHLPVIIDLYRGKRDRMMRAMDQHFDKDQVRWTRSQGGMFTWAVVEGVETVPLLEEAVKMNVAFVPGKSFFVDPAQGSNTMRLNYTHATDDNIDLGIKRLGELLASKRVVA